MHMLQDVLFRHYCNNHTNNQQKEMRKYKHRMKKQLQPETPDLPVYILEKFRNERVLPAREQSNKSVLQKDNTQSEIFVRRNKMSKYRQSLSPLKASKNLREYSNLLFVKKNHQEPKIRRNQHFQTLHQKNSEHKYSTLSALNFYNQNHNKTLKQMQTNTNQLQVKRLPIIEKQNNRRKKYIQALQMQHLTASNIGTYYLSRDRSPQHFENRRQQALQICGWQDGDLFQ